MSAIFGLVNWDERPAEIARLADALAARSLLPPRVWLRGPVALGCTHFATSVEALHEELPLLHQPSGLVLTANARLDDRDDLHAQLGLPGRAGDYTDGALLAEAYLKWGEQSPKHLRGDFVFAIWDSRAQRLFAARDHFGIKPLYYLLERDRVAFASEPRPLLDLPGTSGEIDREVVAGYLAEIYNETNGTAYRAVRRLLPGERMMATAAGVRLDRYYEVAPAPALNARSDEEYADAFRDIFQRAVRRRLRAAVPVGCMLSGGLDSSSIACVAGELRGETTLELFSLMYPDQPKCDEGQYIQAVTRRTGLPWHPVPVHARRTVQDIQDLVHRHQEPNVPFGAFANGSICSTATAGGMGVILDGHGGDETVSLGYERVRELLDNRRLATFSYEYLRLAQADAELGGVYGLLQVLTNVGLAGRVKRKLWHLAGQRSAEAAPPAWPYLNQDLVQEAMLAERNTKVRATQARARADHGWHQYVVTRTAQANLFESADRLSGPRPVELRYPFWDRELVEFCLALPSRQKMRNGYNRAILREALRDILPAPVRQRRDKTDFIPQATQCLLFLGENACRTLIFEDSRDASEMLRLSWMDELIRRFFHGHLVSSTDQQILWRSLCMAAWLPTLSQARRRPELSPPLQVV